MLMPKKVKHRKVQRGRRRGKAGRGNKVSFGDFGLQALEPGWITNRQIEAARVASDSIERLQTVEPYLFPPLIQFKTIQASEFTPDSTESAPSDEGSDR